jgi:nicotinamidase-related amidase
MAERFPIRSESAAVVLNDMFNANLRTGREDHDAAIESSGIIQASQNMVRHAREQGIPVVWIRVERRKDRTDVVDALTDVYIANGCQPKPPLVQGDKQGENVDELPVLEADHVILKPRTDPFIGTDLDLRLRSLGVDTILVGGYATNFGVEAIARTAHGLNYNVVLLSDCCYNVDKAAHDFSLKNIMPTVARVMSSNQAIDLIKGN